MTVCNGCATLGSGHWEPKPQLEFRAKPLKPQVTRRMLTLKKPPAISVEASMELVEGFGKKIRQAREKLGLSYEEFGRKIREKVSVLKKIESEKMTPNHMLASKLEHALKVKLLVPASEPQTSPVMPSTPRRVTTLGDVVQLKKKEKRR